MADFMEVTVATIVAGGKSSAGLQIIALSHIVSISSGGLETGHITLSSGKTINTMESYTKLKTMLGL
jgi:hypothetical protein